MDAKEWNIIMREWNDFPFLKRFGNSKLFFKTEIMLIGLWLDRISGNSYRLSIMGLPLWYKYDDWKHSFCFNNCIKDACNHDIICQYIFQDRYFKRNVEFTKQHYGDIFNGEITYSNLYYLENMYNDPIVGRRKYALNKGHLQFQMVLARYFDNSVMAENILTLVEKVYKKDSNNRKIIEYHESINFSIDLWREDMNNYYGNKEAFLEVCRKHSEDKDIKKLNMGVLINDDPFVKKSIWDKLSDLFKRHQ